MIRSRRVLAGIAAAACVVSLALASSGSSPIAGAQSYQRISGEGSSWSANAIDAMRVNVRQFGITVDYNPSGSTSGRKNFLNGTVDFAASDIPFQFEPEDGSAPENPAPGSYAYIPVTAGGTAFMYNLKINGQRVTNLRLSGENIAKIFTGVITQWNDPALAADNPGLQLPARPIVPVVRSDGSGSTAQFTMWMINQHPAIWTDYCDRSGRAPQCGSTSFYPTLGNMIAQSGDLGVAGYVSQGFAEGAIGYVNYSYSLGVQFPVAKVLNKAGYYTEPTPENVAVSLLQARINTDESNPAVYLTQQLDGVYADTDPRNYPLSSYSYFILPTKEQGQFSAAKGRTLAEFTYYAMCQAQQQSASLGYSPMPINLVTASFDQIAKIPGAEAQNINIQECNNPTFSTDGTNKLAAEAPQPQACDKQGPTQCATGTGGAQGVETPVVSGGNGGDQPAGGGQQAGGDQVGGGGQQSGGQIDGSSAATAANSSGSADGASDGAVSAEPFCDPDTGVCGPRATAEDGGNTSVADGAVGSVTSTTLDQNSGWGGQQVLVLLVISFTLGLIFVPAYFWSRWSPVGGAARKSGSGAAPPALPDPLPAARDYGSVPT